MAATDVLRNAVRVASAWPDNAELLADRVLAVLAEGASNETDLEKRSKLKAGLKGVGRMTRDVLVDVVAAAIAPSTGHTPPVAAHGALAGTRGPVGGHYATTQQRLYRAVKIGWPRKVTRRTSPSAGPASRTGGGLLRRPTFRGSCHGHRTCSSARHRPVAQGIIPR